MSVFCFTGFILSEFFVLIDVNLTVFDILRFLYSSTKPFELANLHLQLINQAEFEIFHYSDQVEILANFKGTSFYFVPIYNLSEKFSRRIQEPIALLF